MGKKLLSVLQATAAAIPAPWVTPVTVPYSTSPGSLSGGWTTTSAILEPAQSAPTTITTTTTTPLPLFSSRKNEKAYSLIYLSLLETVKNNLSHAATDVNQIV
jgi:hypothetical protein